MLFLLIACANDDRLTETRIAELETLVVEQDAEIVRLEKDLSTLVMMTEAAVINGKLAFSLLDHLRSDGYNLDDPCGMYYRNSEVLYMWPTANRAYGDGTVHSWKLGDDRVTYIGLNQLPADIEHLITDHCS